MLLSLAMLAAPVAAVCAYDRPAMLALNEDKFDQDLTGGWRKLAGDGCESAAADLLRDWRTAHPTMERRWLSTWHEGQLRAQMRQDVQAMALFDQSRRPTVADKIGWNHYVDGSIAFLKRDRRAFDAARARLAAFPKPADFDARGPDGKPLTIAWPMNLNVLDGFRRCWGQPYKVAYGPTCSTPMRRVDIPGK